MIGMILAAGGSLLTANIGWYGFAICSIGVVVVVLSQFIES